MLIVVFLETVIVMLRTVFLVLALKALLTTLLGTILGTCRKVLFIVASEIVQGHFVDLNGTCGHAFNILYDHLVVGVFLIVFVALRPHVASQIVNRMGNTLPIGFVGQRAEHLFHIFAVMLEGNAALRIVHRAGRDGQILTRGTRIGRIDIQLEIRHDKEVIPEFVGEVGRIAQERIEVTHDSDDGTCLTVAFAAVFNLHQGVDHFMDVTPVFGQEHLATRVIIVFFHTVTAVHDVASKRPQVVPYGLRR